MKKFLLVFCIILLVAGCAAGGYGCYYYSNQCKVLDSQKQSFVTQNAQLQSEIDAIGPVTKAFTVTADMYTGKVITTEDLIEITVPKSTIVDGETILDPEEILGKYWKIDIKPGTTVTASVVMDSELKETVYEQDMTFQTLPLGIEAGDYVDIKISLPFGQTFYVMTHKRIEQLVLDNYTIKMYLTATELEIWESVLIDVALYKQSGIKLWVSKYVEPGLQDDAVAYYPVRSEIADLIKVSPNIPDYTVCTSDNVRKVFDLWVENVETDDGAKLYSGVNTEASGINSARNKYLDSGQSGNFSTVGDGTVIDGDMDLGDYITQIEQDLNTMGGMTSTDETETETEDNTIEEERPIE